VRGAIISLAKTKLQGAKMNVTTSVANLTTTTTIKVCASDVRMFMAMTIAVSVAAIVGVGIGLYLCRRSLRAVRK